MFPGSLLSHQTFQISRKLAMSTGSFIKYEAKTLGMPYEPSTLALVHQQVLQLEQHPQHLVLASSLSHLYHHRLVKIQ